MNELVTKRSDGKVLYGGRLRTSAQIEKLKAAARESSKQRQQRRAEDRKRKAGQIQTGLLVDGQQSSQSEDASLKDMGWTERVEWVFGHLSCKHCPSGGDDAARVLWRVAKKDAQRFVKIYLPLLLKREAKEPERDLEAERQDRKGKELIQEWLQRRHIKPCPTCDGKGWREEDFKAP